MKMGNTKTLKILDEMIASGAFTEFQKQQALFYIRMGILNDSPKRVKDEITENEKSGYSA